MTGILNHQTTAVIQFHNTLHRFRMDRGTMTASLEAKLLQHLIAMREEVLYEIFLYLHKVYDNLDRDHCMYILAAYGVPPWAIFLLQRYCYQLNMVARTGGYFGAPFKGQSGVTKGYPLKLNIFNDVVDAFLRHWVTMVAEMEETADPSTEGFGWDIQWMTAYF